MTTPKSGADAKKIRESFDLTQPEWAKLFKYNNREDIASIERQEKLTRMQSWFYWYVKKFGLPGAGKEEQG